MTIFDTILIIAIAGFVFYGLFFGLIRVIGSIFGIIVGAFVASHFYLQFFNWIEPVFMGFSNLGKVISFLILLSIAWKITSFAFIILDKAFNLISIIPFLKMFNRLGGAILGFVEGALVIGLLLYVSARYSVVDFFFGKWLVESEVAPFLLKFVKLLMPFLSEGLKMLKSLI